MNLMQIKSIADSEKIDISYYISDIAHKRRTSPGGSDLNIPSKYQKDVEFFCDMHGIPFFTIGENSCSTAASYSELLTYENKR